jgi:hypothetical protein
VEVTVPVIVVVSGAVDGMSVGAFVPENGTPVLALLADERTVVVEVVVLELYRLLLDEEVVDEAVVDLHGLNLAGHTYASRSRKGTQNPTESPPLL